jgi:hypothetical protein
MHRLNVPQSDLLPLLRLLVRRASRDQFRHRHRMVGLGCLAVGAEEVALLHIYMDMVPHIYKAGVNMAVHTVRKVVDIAVYMGIHMVRKVVYTAVHIYKVVRKVVYTAGYI